MSDLRHRSLVSLSGLKIFRVPMDDCPVGFEARELGVVGDLLAEVMTRERRKPAPRLTDEPKDGIVTLDGTRYQVGDEAAAIVQVILNAKKWISYKNIKSEVKKQFGLEISHPERTKQNLPKVIRDAIDVDRQKGHRIKDEYLG